MSASAALRRRTVRRTGLYAEAAHPPGQHRVVYPQRAELQLLGHVGRHLGPLLPFHGAQRLSVKEDLPLLWCTQPQRCFQQCGFAAAVAAQQHTYLSCFQ